MQSGAVPWLSHPMASHLLRANFLPSSLAHPQQIQAWAGVDGETLQHWPNCLAVSLGPASDRSALAMHRAVSRALIRHWRLEPISGLGEPAVPLCLLPPPAFERMAVHIGLVFLAPALCRVIARPELAALDLALGASTLHFVRRHAAALRPPQAPLPTVAEHPPSAAAVPGVAGAMGAAVLAQCFADVPDPVGRRGLLRLPPDVDLDLLPPDLADGIAARALAHAVLQLLEPEWLSHFPALH